MNVGFVGLGNMGAPMAANLAKAGHHVIAFDTLPGRAAELAARIGGGRVTAAADFAAFAPADFVVTMLPTGREVRDVCLGAGGLAQHLRRGAIVIDMSSADPSGTRALGADLAPHGITLIDAPVSGGVPRATDGTLAIMIGGNDPAAIEKAKVVLASLGQKLFETGSLGCGHAMKALNNFVAAAGYTAAAEALIAGRRFGLDPGRMLDIMNVSTGRNFNTEVVMKDHVVGEKYATGFTLGLLAKDVGIAANLMRAVELDAPLAQLVSRRYAAARDALGGERDNTVAILAWDKDSE